MGRVQLLALVIFTMVIDSLPVILNGQCVIITDYPFYTTFDVIHYSALSVPQNFRYFAVELVDWQGKTWQQQKQLSDNRTINGAVTLNDQMPSGFYWIRLYPAAFYQSRVAPVYYPVAIVNSGDLIGDRWKRKFTGETGKAKIKTIHTDKKISMDFMPTQFAIVNETGEIISGSGYYENSKNGERISISSDRDGVFSVISEVGKGSNYLIRIGIEPGDTLSALLTSPDVSESELVFSENTIPEPSSHRLRLATDKLIYSDVDEVALSIESESGLSLTAVATFIVMIHESASSQVSFNTNRVLLARTNDPNAISRTMLSVASDDGQYLLRGRYINPETFFPRSHCAIAMFAFGKYPWMWFRQTDAEGNFFMDISKLKESTTIYISTINQPINGLSYKDEFYLEFPERPYIFFNQSDFCALDSFVIIAKIRNVLDHQYFEIKPVKEENTSQVLSEILLYDTVKIYPKPDLTYNLNDYVKFESMTEVIQNILNNVHLNKTKNVTELYIYHKQYPDLNRNPLILINGIPTLDPEQMLNLNIQDVHRIDILYSNSALLPFGITGLGGVIAVYTSQPVYMKNLEKFNYQGLHQSPGEYRPKLSADLPDFSPVLYWNPGVSMENDRIHVRFLTNNLLTDLKVRVIGTDENGRIIQETGVINIEDKE
ncbi:MAG TPA: hypothetical protein VI583_12490 [Cyclobacteriaceae bacterium]|nr:hypothetical protein [Cyclobacteriaceae bacterium]